jgi:hypothetical protein
LASASWLAVSKQKMNVPPALLNLMQRACVRLKENEELLRIISIHCSKKFAHAISFDEIFICFKKDMHWVLLRLKNQEDLRVFDDDATFFKFEIKNGAIILPQIQPLQQILIEPASTDFSIRSKIENVVIQQVRIHISYIFNAFRKNVE